MDILSQFGVQPILLLAQIVNFLILLWVLRKILYGPLLKVLRERRETIAESLKNAERIEKKLENIGKEREQALLEAANEAKVIVDDAAKSASQIIEEAHNRANGDVEKMIDRAQKDMALERDRLHDEIREELADLVVTSLQKIVGKTLNDSDKKRLIDDSLKNLR
jgi:F-type H+-transporting ATPase subunit b